MGVCCRERQIESTTGNSAKTTLAVGRITDTDHHSGLVYGPESVGLRVPFHRQQHFRSFALLEETHRARWTRPRRESSALRVTSISRMLSWRVSSRRAEIEPSRSSSVSIACMLRTDCASNALVSQVRLRHHSRTPSEHDEVSGPLTKEGYASTHIFSWKCSPQNASATCAQKPLVNALIPGRTATRGTGVKPIRTTLRDVVLASRAAMASRVANCRLAIVKAKCQEPLTGHSEALGPTGMCDWKGVSNNDV